MSCLAKRLIWYEKSLIAVIIALLLISSAVTLTISPFQKASAQKTALPNRLLPGQEEQQQQETGTSDAASNKAQEAFNQNNRLPPTSDQGQQTGTSTLQPLQPQGEEEEEDKENKGKGKAKGKNKDNIVVFVPIATSGNNVYIVWPSNKTTADFEIMFKVSNDGGTTFGNKTNLSNTPNIDSINAEISAAGNNVYVSWWERNATSNEPVLRVSNDNGKTFGEKIMLSSK
jgi:hypothetical protein